MNIPKTEDGRFLNYDRDGHPLKMDAKPSIRYTVTGEPYKQCSYFKRWLPLSEFEKSSSSRSKDGYNSVSNKGREKIDKNMKKTHEKITEMIDGKADKEEKPVKTEAKVKEESPKPEKRTLESMASESPELAAEWRQRSGCNTGDTLAMLYELRRRGIHGTVTYIDMPITI